MRLAITAVLALLATTISALPEELPESVEGLEARNDAYLPKAITSNIVKDRDFLRKLGGYILTADLGSNGEGKQVAYAHAPGNFVGAAIVRIRPATFASGPFLISANMVADSVTQILACFPGDSTGSGSSLTSIGGGKDVDVLVLAKLC